LRLLSGDLDFGFFQFLPVFTGGGTLTLTLTPQALEYHRIFYSLEHHQNLSLLEHHRTLPFSGGRPTVVTSPPGWAPPILWEPSGSPPPLLLATPPAPPFLAVLSLGVSLRGWRHAGFLLFLLGVTQASGSPVTGTRGTLDEYFAMRNIVETSNACELPGVSIKYGPFLECMWRAVEKGDIDI
jgi:hypothetical protein